MDVDVDFEALDLVEVWHRGAWHEAMVSEAPEAGGGIVKVALDEDDRELEVPRSAVRKRTATAPAETTSAAWTPMVPAAWTPAAPAARTPTVPAAGTPTVQAAPSTPKPAGPKLEPPPNEATIMSDASAEGNIKQPSLLSGGDWEMVEEEDTEEDDRFVQTLLDQEVWKKPGIKALVQNLLSLGLVSKEELPKKVDKVPKTLLVDLLKRFKAGVEAPLEAFARHLKPALVRRIHVGTMDYLGQSHESYRKAFEFIETTTTWHDTDSESRWVPAKMRTDMGCGYQPVSKYEELAERARDRFQMVVKVSCVGTHIMKLQEIHDWWPKLYKEKYSKLESATVAFLWQFPPSFVYGSINFQRLQRLAAFLQTQESGAQEARHIVDFRDGSWYNDDVYSFLRQQRWCLAWLHLNNEKGWASNLPSGWTDRVQTTNFCFCRLFGPDGASNGSYDKRFLHDLFDSCPAGTTTYVLFGNQKTTEGEDVFPTPALRNAQDFRTIFTKMDFVERVRNVRYRGECPRVLNAEEQLLLNSFYLRFSAEARSAGITMATPLCSQVAKKYYEQAIDGKRCFEWYFPDTKKRFHLSLHDAKEDEDIWRYLRQLTGMEDLEAAKEWVEKQGAWGWDGKGYQGPFSKEERALLTGTFIRWSRRARAEGLLASTELYEVRQDGTVVYQLSNGEWLELGYWDCSPDQDLWSWFTDLSRVPEEQLSPGPAEEESDPWSDGTWRMNAGEMVRRAAEEKKAKAAAEEALRAETEAEEAVEVDHWQALRDAGDGWSSGGGGDSWKTGGGSWKNDGGGGGGNSWKDGGGGGGWKSSGGGGWKSGGGDSGDSGSKSGGGGWKSGGGGWKSGGGDGGDSDWKSGGGGWKSDGGWKKYGS